MQEPDEVLELTRFVAEHNPETVVEIGAANGGTLYLWRRLLASARRIVSIDIEPVHGRRERFYRCFEPANHALTGSEERTDETDIHCIVGPPTSDRVLEDIRQQAAADHRDGGKIDFLFIDGDHTYEGVRADFERYVPLVSEGGVIAFHDIVERPDKPFMGVDEFWREVSERPGFEAHEFVVPRDKDRGGIGALVK